MVELQLEMPTSAKYTRYITKYGTIRILALMWNAAKISSFSIASQGVLSTISSHYS